MLERGKVKFFNSIKKYGFLSLENGKQLFFHISSGKKISVTRRPLPQFINPTSDQPLRVPIIGEEIIFEKHNTGKGPSTVYWAYAKTYDKAVNIIANRPNK